MDILVFFNPCNLKHLKAYKYLQENGTWPTNFIPKNIKIKYNYNWFLDLNNMIINHYIASKLKITQYNKN